MARNNSSIESVSSITVRLLKRGRNPLNAVSANYASGGAKELIGLDWESEGEGLFYYGQVYDSAPGWVSLLQNHVSEAFTPLHASGAAALLFLKVRKRWMLLTFGYAHLALDDDAFVHQFGLRVALNSIDRGDLLSFDVATPDAVTFQRRVQASKFSDLSQFNIDTLRDLARVAGGKPRDLEFSKFVAGKDALSLDAHLTPDQFHGKCVEIFDAYEAKTYRKDYGWFDNIRIETRRSRLNQLDNLLHVEIQRIRDGGVSGLHMSPPEIQDYVAGTAFRYAGFKSRTPDFTKHSIEDYASELNRLNCRHSIEEIKSSHKIRAHEPLTSKDTKTWKVFDCLNWEVLLPSKPPQNYVLFAGKWYRISKKFKDTVDQHFDSIPNVSIIGPTHCQNEEQLIKEIEATRPDLIKLDRKKINPEGVIDANLEPCDYYSDQQYFIHLKDGESSGPISHLWMQGVVSAEAFMHDGVFRSKLKEVVRTTANGAQFVGSLPDGRAKEVPRDTYTVIYGIMRYPYVDGSLGIPFFSKVSLIAACNQLKRAGMKIGKEIIAKQSPRPVKPKKLASAPRKARPSKKTP